MNVFYEVEYRRDWHLGRKKRQNQSVRKAVFNWSWSPGVWESVEKRHLTAPFGIGSFEASPGGRCSPRTRPKKRKRSNWFKFWSGLSISYRSHVLYFIFALASDNENRPRWNINWAIYLQVFRSSISSSYVKLAGRNELLKHFTFFRVRIVVNSSISRMILTEGNMNIEPLEERKSIRKIVLF